jgi:hypothetical protein
MVPERITHKRMPPAGSNRPAAHAPRDRRNDQLRSARAGSSLDTSLPSVRMLPAPVVRLFESSLLLFAAPPIGMLRIDGSVADVVPGVVVTVGDCAFEFDSGGVTVVVVLGVVVVTLGGVIVTLGSVGVVTAPGPGVAVELSVLGLVCA